MASGIGFNAKKRHAVKARTRVIAKGWPRLHRHRGRGVADGKCKRPAPACSETLPDRSTCRNRILTFWRQAGPDVRNFIQMLVQRRDVLSQLPLGQPMNTDCILQVAVNSSFRLVGRSTPEAPVLRRLRNPVVIFGIVIVLLSWAGACLQVFAERAHAIRVAVERGETAIQLFEKDTVSLLKSIDAIMLLLRQGYEDDQQHFDLIRLVELRARPRQRCLDGNLPDWGRWLSQAANALGPLAVIGVYLGRSPAFSRPGRREA